MNCFHCEQLRQEFLCADCANRKIKKKVTNVDKLKDEAISIENEWKLDLAPKAELESLRLQLHQIRKLTAHFQSQIERKIERLQCVMRSMEKKDEDKDKEQPANRG
jgi:gas vesicle protein